MREALLAHPRCAIQASIGGGYLRALPPEKKLEKQLKAPIDISFENTPLKAVLDELREINDINIVADKPALAEAGVSLESPITMKLEQIALKSALNLILHQVKLTYIIKGDVLQITSPECARGKRRRVTYPVADLVIDQWTEVQLIDLITRSIARHSWKVMGGKGTIEYSKTELKITVFQTLEVQEQVQDMFAALRRLPDLRKAVYDSLAKVGRTMDLLGDLRKALESLVAATPLPVYCDDGSQ